MEGECGLGTGISQLAASSNNNVIRSQMVYLVIKPETLEVVRPPLLVRI